MKKLGHSGGVACEVTFRTFWHTFPAPTDENAFRQTSVGVLDLHEGVLYSSIRELFYEVDQFTLCKEVSVRIPGA